MSQPEAISLVLTLHLSGPLPAGRLPAWWGRAAQEALLSLVRQQDPALSAELHDGHRRKPYTVSSLSSLKLDWPNPPDLTKPCRLRFTAIDPRLAALLLDAAGSGSLRPGETLELDRLPFAILASAWQDDDWAFCGSWTQVWAMVDGLELSNADNFSLHFNSPTYFSKSKEKVYERLPLPELVFDEVSQMATTWAGLRFDFPVKEYASQRLRLAGSYGLRTDQVESRPGVLRSGASGQFDYQVLDPTPQVARAFHKLACVAFFCGAGKETTVGFGQVRVAR